MGFSLTVAVTGAITGVVRGAVLGNIKGRIFDVLVGGGWVVLNGFGFCTGNLIGSDTFNIFAFQRKFCSARATVTCSCSSIFALSDDEPSDCCTNSFREDQAAIAAFFSACFLFLAGSPVNLTPANSTVQLKAVRCPWPDRKVVYIGKAAPTLCETSCRRFL